MQFLPQSPDRARQADLPPGDIPVGLAEILVRRLLESLAVEGDDALVAALRRALVDGSRTARGRGGPAAC
jgi:hypothetical protein